MLGSTTLVRRGGARLRTVQPRQIARFYAQDFQIKRQLRLPKQHMYEIVGDVAKYHEFVPYCLESTITRRGEKGQPTNAVLRVGWNQLDERFESRLHYDENKVIAIAADNKMFKELRCEWTVEESGPQTCSVALSLRFQFQNALYDFMAQGAGPLVSRRMIEAFTKRAMEQNRKKAN